MAQPLYDPYISRNKKPTEGQYGLTRLQAEVIPQTASLHLGSQTCLTSTGACSGMSSTGGLLHSLVNHLVTFGSGETSSTVDKGTDTSAIEDASLQTWRKDVSLTSIQHDDSRFSGIGKMSYPMASISTSVEHTIRQPDTDNGSCSLDWLSDYKKFTADNSSKPFLSFFSNYESSANSSNEKGRDMISIPGLGDDENPVSDQPVTPPQPSQNNCGLTPDANILSRFGLDAEDLEHLISYPQELLTHTNLPVILHQIRLQKTKSAASVVQSKPDTAHFASRGRTAFEGLSSSTGARTQQNGVVSAVEQLQTSRYSGEFEAANGGSNVLVTDTYCGCNPSHEPLPENTSAVKSSHLGSYQDQTSSVTPDLKKSSQTQIDQTFQLINSNGFPKKDTKGTIDKSGPPKCIVLRELQADHQQTLKTQPAPIFSAQSGRMVFESNGGKGMQDQHTIQGQNSSDCRQEKGEIQHKKPVPLTQTEQANCPTSFFTKNPTSADSHIPGAVGVSGGIPRAGLISWTRAIHNVLQWPVPAEQNASAALLPSHSRSPERVSVSKDLPTLAMTSDCAGAVPKLFPHTCSLCNTECAQFKDWLSHKDTSLHLQSCKLLEKQYPDLIDDNVQVSSVVPKEAKPSCIVSPLVSRQPGQKATRESLSSSRSPSPENIHVSHCMEKKSTRQKSASRSQSWSSTSSRSKTRSRSPLQDSSSSCLSSSSSQERLYQNRRRTARSPTRRSHVSRSPTRRSHVSRSPTRRSRTSRSPTSRGRTSRSPTKRSCHERRSRPTISHDSSQERLSPQRWSHERRAQRTISYDRNQERQSERTSRRTASHDSSRERSSPQRWSHDRRSGQTTSHDSSRERPSPQRWSHERQSPQRRLGKPNLKRKCHERWSPETTNADSRTSGSQSPPAKGHELQSLKRGSHERCSLLKKSCKEKSRQRKHHKKESPKKQSPQRSKHDHSKGSSPSKQKKLSNTEKLAKKLLRPALKALAQQPDLNALVETMTPALMSELIKMTVSSSSSSPLPAKRKRSSSSSKVKKKKSTKSSTKLKPGSGNSKTSSSSKNEVAKSSHPALVKLRSVPASLSREDLVAAVEPFGETKSVVFFHSKQEAHTGLRVAHVYFNRKVDAKKLKRIKILTIKGYQIPVSKKASVSNVQKKLPQKSHPVSTPSKWKTTKTKPSDNKKPASRLAESKCSGSKKCAEPKCAILQKKAVKSPVKSPKSIIKAKGLVYKAKTILMRKTTKTETETEEEVTAISVGRTPTAPDHPHDVDDPEQKIVGSPAPRSPVKAADGGAAPPTNSVTTKSEMGDAAAIETNSTVGVDSSPCETAFPAAPKQSEAESAPCSSAAVLKKEPVPMDNVTEPETLRERLLSVEVCNTSLDTVRVVMEMVTSIAPVVSSLPLANRIYIEMISSSGLTKVLETYRGYSPSVHEDCVTWSTNVGRFESVDQSHQRLRDSTDIPMNLNAYKDVLEALQSSVKLQTLHKNKQLLFLQELLGLERTKQEQVIEDQQRKMFEELRTFEKQQKLDQQQRLEEQQTLVQEPQQTNKELSPPASSTIELPGSHIPTITTTSGVTRRPKLSSAVCRNLVLPSAALKPIPGPVNIGKKLPLYNRKPQERLPSLVMMCDYAAVTPKNFPHTCSLCNIQCTNIKVWLHHQNSSFHLQSCKSLRKRYPLWDGDVKCLTSFAGSQVHSKQPYQESRSGSRSRSRLPSPTHHVSGSTSEKRSSHHSSPSSNCETQSSQKTSSSRVARLAKKLLKSSAAQSLSHDSNLEIVAETLAPVLMAELAKWNSSSSSSPPSSSSMPSLPTGGPSSAKKKKLATSSSKAKCSLKQVEKAGGKKVVLSSVIKA